MPDTPALVRTCPDCGGILQSIGVEDLLAAEIDRNVGSDREPHDPFQCLICGYQEPAADAARVSSR